MTSIAIDFGESVKKIREDFPLLRQKIYGKPLIYLDNAATTQKPRQVIDCLTRFYSEYNSNIHRGIHFLAQKVTDEYEKAREKVRTFIRAKHAHEIIFTKGTTESINLVASSFGKKFIKNGDEVVISAMEHHSNLIPWQILCEDRGAILKVIPITENGELEINRFEDLLSSRTRIVAVTHVSNTLGTINPLKEIVQRSHRAGIPVLADGAQAIAHMPVNVQDLDCDFYCFSGHKIYGPTGIGVLYGKEKFLDAMPPYQGGGSMIKSVTFEKTTYGDLPLKFEAGTPPVSEAIGLGAAIDYVQAAGFVSIKEWEDKLTRYALDKMAGIIGIKFIGNAKERVSVISFLIENLHPYDVAVLLDKFGIAVRTGHHCTQPIMDRYKIPGTVRASFAVYNTMEEVDNMVEALHKIKTMLS